MITVLMTGGARCAELALQKALQQMEMIQKKTIVIIIFNRVKWVLDGGKVRGNGAVGARLKYVFEMVQRWRQLARAERKMAHVQ